MSCLLLYTHSLAQGLVLSMHICRMTISVTLFSVHEYVLLHVCVPPGFVRSLFCVYYVPDHRNKGSLGVCVGVPPLAGHRCHFFLFSLSTFCSPLPFTDGLTVLLCSLLLGERVIGELEAGDYFNVHTSFASLVSDAGVGMAVQHRERGLPAAQVGQL